MIFDFLIILSKKRVEFMTNEEFIKKKMYLLASWLEKLFNMKLGSEINEFQLGNYEMNASRPFKANGNTKKEDNSEYLSGKLLMNYLALVIHREKLQEAVNLIKEFKKFDIKLYYHQKCPCGPEFAAYNYSCLVDKFQYELDYEICLHCPVRWLYHAISYIDKHMELFENSKQENDEYYESSEYFGKFDENNLISFMKDVSGNLNDLGKMECEDSVFQQWIYTRIVYYLSIRYSGYVYRELLNPDFFTSEENIYQILCKASNIMKKLEIHNEKLLADIEADKIVSYVNYIYSSPFSYSEKECKEIISNAFDVIERCESYFNKLYVYIELFYLLAVTNIRLKNIDRRLNSVKEKIEKIYKNNKDIAVIKILYLKYIYYNYLLKNNLSKEIKCPEDEIYEKKIEILQTLYGENWSYQEVDHTVYKILRLWDNTTTISYKYSTPYEYFRVCGDNSSIRFVPGFTSNPDT